MFKMRTQRTARSSIHQTHQARSKRTQDLILEAAESLLKERPLSEISITEIVAKAGVSVGTYYVRFSSKEAVLEALYERYDRALHAEMDELERSEAWEGMSLRELAERHVSWLVRFLREHRWLMREMTLFARQHPDRLNETLTKERARLFERWKAPFLARASEIGHEEVADAVSFALFLVTTNARELVLYGDLPQARTVDSSDGALIEQLSTAMCAYLRGDSRS